MTATATPAKSLSTLQKMPHTPSTYYVDNAEQTRRYVIGRTESRDWSVEVYELVANGRILELGDGETMDTRTWTRGDKLRTEWESTRTLALMFAEGMEASYSGRTQDFLDWCAARSA